MLTLPLGGHLLLKSPLESLSGWGIINNGLVSSHFHLGSSWKELGAHPRCSCSNQKGQDRDYNSLAFPSHIAKHFWPPRGDDPRWLLLAHREEMHCCKGWQRGVSVPLTHKAWLGSLHTSQKVQGTSMGSPLTGQERSTINSKCHLRGCPVPPLNSTPYNRWNSGPKAWFVTSFKASGAIDINDTYICALWLSSSVAGELAYIRE